MKVLTANRQVNRLLAELETELAGRPPSAEPISLSDLEDDYVALIRVFPDEESQQLLHDALQPLLDGLALWSDWSGRAAPADLQRWRDQIVAASRELDSRFDESVQIELAPQELTFPPLDLLLHRLPDAPWPQLALLADYCAGRQHLLDPHSPRLPALQELGGVADAPGSDLDRRSWRTRLRLPDEPIGEPLRP